MQVIDLNNTTPDLTAGGNPSDDTSTYTPDELTQKRFRNLAIVGMALMQTESEDKYQTDFYLAERALDDYVELYNRLELDPESREGMDLLISYLRRKIARRLKASIATSGV